MDGAEFPASESHQRSAEIPTCTLYFLCVLHNPMVISELFIPSVMGNAERAAEALENFPVVHSLDF